VNQFSDLSMMVPPFTYFFYHFAVECFQIPGCSNTAYLLEIKLLSYYEHLTIGLVSDFFRKMGLDVFQYIVRLTHPCPSLLRREGFLNFRKML